MPIFIKISGPLPTTGHFKKKVPLKIRRKISETEGISSFSVISLYKDKD
jgi:hypothetical protein